MKKLIFFLIVLLFGQLSHAQFTSDQTIDKDVATLFLGSGGDSGPHGFVFDDESGPRLQLVYRTSPNQLILEKYTDGTHLFWIDYDTEYSFFKGNVGIGTTSPFQKLSVKDGQLFLGNSTTNKYESGRIRFSEYESSFQGAFIHYDGSQNTFNIGVHEINDSDVANDVNAISIKRNNGDVGIGTSNPSSKFHIAGSGAVIKLQDTSNEDTDNAFFGWIGGYDKSGDEVWWLGEGSSGSKALGLHTARDGYDLRVWNKGSGIVVKNGGSVGIGTSTPDEKLTVKGKIHAEEVKVDLSVPGPDYVFEKDYDLKSLEEIEAFIKSNKHLPEVPSAKEMEENGVELGTMNMLLLKKIEELTLYTLEQEKELELHRKLINELLKDKK